MAWHAILHAETLAAVIVTDGRGSNTSADVKQAAYPALASDLSAILSAVRALFVYTHNPVDFPILHASPEKI